MRAARGPILHADVDCFFASVALRDRPDLADRPVAVVAHVFVASATYPARAFGVRGGQHVDDALRLCPRLILFEVDRDEVEQVGDALFDVFRSSADAVEAGSIEEAFLDVGAADDAEALEAARRLRRRVADELRIPLSVGIGRTRLIAKLASRAAKPDGIHVIDADSDRALRATLPLRHAWGVGGTTIERLAQVGVTELGQIDDLSEAELRHLCGTGMARRLRKYRDSTDDATVRSGRERRSITAEVSTSGYRRPDHSPEDMLATCVARACKRAGQLGLVATMLRITLVLPDATTSILRTPPQPATSDVEVWQREGAALLATMQPPPLSGLRATLEGLTTPDRAGVPLF